VDWSSERFVPESQIGLARDHSRVHEQTGRYSPRTETLAAEAWPGAQTHVFAFRTDFSASAGIAGGGQHHAEYQWL
jgi:hypothetical protein